ncbi:MAG: 2'-5' RNA ligase family protein [Promethearchaeota archaeon]
MKKTHTSAVVVIPPREVWDSIQNIRKKHDRQFYRWMPHVNLIYPFRPEIEFDSLTPEFENKCKKIESFEVSLKDFKYFHYGKNRYTVWLEPTPTSPIKALQSEILKIVPDCDDLNKHKGGFTPHLSVGQINRKINLKEMVDSFKRSWETIRFTIKEIYFITRQKNNESSFQVKKRICLKYKN